MNVIDKMIELIEQYDGYNYQPSNKNVGWRQLRALFTTYCIIEDVECDTMASDNLLMSIYRKLQNYDISYYYNDFESYMIGDII